MELWPYFSIFGIALLAATLVPAQSELALAALLAAGRYDATLLIAAATAGNVLGSLVNWLIGRFLNGCRERSWFPVPPKALERAERAYRRWGVWTLLLSWAPIVGDPLTLVAGLLRTPLKIFLPLVLIAKAGRYCVVAGLIQLAAAPTPSAILSWPGADGPVKSATTASRRQDIGRAAAM